MKQIRLFRKRFLPDEIIELKDDIVLSISEDLLITKWDVLKPRKDIARGVSAYFLKLGIKVSKVYNADDKLVYWYCDIVEPQIEQDSYVFVDLLIDVLIYPDGFVKVVDMDEFADMMENDTLQKGLSIKALRRNDHLLSLIYSDKFSQLTDLINEAEKKTACC